MRFIALCVTDKKVPLFVYKWIKEADNMIKVNDLEEKVVERFNCNLLSDCDEEAAERFKEVGGIVFCVESQCVSGQVL